MLRTTPLLTNHLRLVSHMLARFSFADLALLKYFVIAIGFHEIGAEMVQLDFDIFGQVQVQKTASFAMNSRASLSGRMTLPMSPISFHLRLCDQ